MWGGSPPASWPKQLQSCIGRLRRVLGSTAIETTRGSYRLRLGDEDLDVRQFEICVRNGRALHAAGQHLDAAKSFVAPSTSGAVHRSQICTGGTRHASQRRASRNSDATPRTAGSTLDLSPVSIATLLWKPRHW